MVPTLDEVVRFLDRELRPGDLCLVLGAGDVGSLPDRLLGGPDPAHGPGAVGAGKP